MADSFRGNPTAPRKEWPNKAISLIVAIPSLLLTTLAPVQAIPPGAQSLPAQVHQRRDLGPDTSSGTTLTLRPAVTVGRPPLIQQAKVWPEVKADTSQSQALSLAVVAPSPPFVPVLYASPIRTQWQPADTSADTPKPAFGDAQPPVFNAPNYRVPRLEQVHAVVNTAAGTPATLLEIALPPGQASFCGLQRARWQLLDTSQGAPKVTYSDAIASFVPAPQFAPLRYPGLPADTSRGTAKVVTADAQAPIANAPQLQVARQPQVADTSQSGALDLVVAPFVQASHIGPQRFAWSPLDTSRGIAKTAFADDVAPFVPAPHLQQQYRAPWLADTSQGQSAVLKPIAPFVQAPHIGPLTFAWLPADTTQDMQPFLRVSLPVVPVAHIAPVRYPWILADTTQTLIAYGDTTPAFTPAPHFAPLRFQWQPLDTSAAIPTALALRTFYFKDVAIGLSGSLQLGGTAPTAATTGTGWTVETVVSGKSLYQVYNAELGSAQFGSDLYPDFFTDLSANQANWVSETPFSGTYTAGNWSFSFGLRSVTAAASGTVRVRFRVWRASNQIGSTGVELTSTTQVTSTVGPLSTSSDAVATATWAAPSITLNSEYLIVQVGVEIVTASGATDQDALFRVGNAYGIDTPAFTAGVTAPFVPAPHFAPLKYLWLPANTSYGTTAPLLPVVVVAGTDVLRSPLIQQAKARPEVNADTWRGTPLPLVAVVPAPFVPVLYASPVKPQWQPANASAGTPKAIYGDAVPAIVPPPHLAPQRYPSLPADTSHGIAKVAFGDAVPPFIALPYFAPQRYPSLPADTSRGDSVLLQVSTPNDLIGDVGVLVLTGIAGSIGQSVNLVGDVGALVLTGQAGSVDRQDNQLLAGSVGTLVLSGVAGVVQQSDNLAGDSGSLLLTGIAGSIQQNTTLAGDVGTLVLTGQAGSVDRQDNQFLAGAVGDLVLTGQAGAVGQSVNLDGDVGGLSLAGDAGSINQSVNLVGTVGALSLSGIAGEVDRTDRQFLDGDVGVLTLAGVAGAIDVSTGAVLVGDIGQLALTGVAGAIDQTQNQELAGAVGSLSLTGIGGSIPSTTSEIIVGPAYSRLPFQIAPRLRLVMATIRTAQAQTVHARGFVDVLAQIRTAQASQSVLADARARVDAEANTSNINRSEAFGDARIRVSIVSQQSTGILELAASASVRGEITSGLFAADIPPEYDGPEDEDILPDLIRKAT